MRSTAFTVALALTAGVTLFSTHGAASQQITGDASATAAALPATNYNETPAWADSFADSIGMDAAYEDNRYPAQVTQQLLWSGIRHLRDGGAPSSTFTPMMKYLGQHGVKHSIGLARGFAASELRSRLNVFMPYVDYVEPANEADNNHSPPANYGQMKSDQRNIWNVVRGNSAWSNVKIGGPSFADPKDHARFVGPIDQYEDFGQVHSATCDWNPGIENGASIDIVTADIRVTTLYKPIWTTETGYNDSPTRGCSIPDDIIAKYLTRTVTERWLHGETRTYFDALVENPTDVAFGNLGLLRSSGTPKPQFVALGNLIRLLADPGSQPRRTPVSYMISGATSDVHHILLGRRDGTFDLLIYREIACWDHHSRRRIAAGADSVQLTIPRLKNAVLYKYNSSYSFSSSTLAIGSNRETARFPVTDSISVVHFGF